MPTSLPLAIEGLVSFWDFQEAEGSVRQAKGPGTYVLAERGGSVPVVAPAGGPFGERAVSCGAGAWLEIPRAQCPKLDLHGPDAEVSIVAWINRSRNPQGGCEAVAGMWNEHGRRQYCLFLNLGIHESSQQVGAHISAVGGPTPGHKYCMDAAIGTTPVPFGRWQCAAITYGKGEARAYLNGRLDERGGTNPYHYPAGIFTGGPDGADFTVGAVARPDRVDMRDGRPVEIGHVQANLFHGLLGGLAIYDRALDSAEIDALAALLGSDMTATKPLLAGAAAG